MAIALLPSEIARLVLSYLKEENLGRTFETFLDECKYLEECKLYFKRGLTLPRTIHGKTLEQYLVIAPDELNTRETRSISSQTDPPLAVQTAAIQTDCLQNESLANVSMGAGSQAPPTDEKQDHDDGGGPIVLPMRSLNSSRRNEESFCEPIDTESEDAAGTGGGNRRLLIGKNVEKLPNLSVSTLERELVSIMHDAQSIMKSVEEDEMAASHASQDPQQTSTLPATTPSYETQQQPPPQPQQQQYQVFEYADASQDGQMVAESKPLDVQSCLSDAGQNEIVFVMEPAGAPVSQRPIEQQPPTTYVTTPVAQRQSQPIYYGLVTGPPGMQQINTTPTRLIQQPQSLVIMPQIAMGDPSGGGGTRAAPMSASSPLINRTATNLKVNLINALNDKVKIGKLTPSKPPITPTRSIATSSRPSEIANPILSGIFNNSNAASENSRSSASKRTKAAKEGPAKKVCNRGPTIKHLYAQADQIANYEPKKRGRKSTKQLYSEMQAAAAAAAASASVALSGPTVPVLTNTTNIGSHGHVQISHQSVDILNLFNAVDPKQQTTLMQSDELSELMSLINETQNSPNMGQMTTAAANQAHITASGRMLRSRSKL